MGVDGCRLWQIIFGTLPLDQATILDLIYGDGMSVAEVAAALSISEESAEELHREALAKLKDNGELAGEFGNAS